MKTLLADFAKAKHREASQHLYGWPAFLCWLLTVLICVVAPPAGAQQATGSIAGAVRNDAGDAIGDAAILLQRNGAAEILQTKTGPEGKFVFSNLAPGVYTLRAEHAKWGKAVADSIAVGAGETKKFTLVLGAGGIAKSDSPKVGSGNSPPGLQFNDAPNFAIAGITDTNNVGLHASATDVRSSGALARDTRALDLSLAGADLREAGLNDAGAATEQNLKQELARAPRSFAANEQLGEFYCHTGRYSEAIAQLKAAAGIEPGSIANARALALAYAGSGDAVRAREEEHKVAADNSAQAHRFLGDIHEQLSEPLAAVHEYEQAVRLEANEENYFAWGAELLVHRAAQAAREVFVSGLKAYPESAKMFTGLGAALFAEGNYDEAAQRLCAAANLKPNDPAPYIFLGKMEKATARVLPCSEAKLATFASQQPDSATANYYYALVLWKKAKTASDAHGLERAETLLEKAVALDLKMGDAFLQLGIVRADRGDLNGAMAAYQKAIEAAPRLGEAHYRLSLAYRRAGDEAASQREMESYKEISKADEAEFARQQKELQQFLVVLKKPMGDVNPQ